MESALSEVDMAESLAMKGQLTKQVESATAALETAQQQTAHDQVAVPLESDILTASVAASSASAPLSGTHAVLLQIISVSGEPKAHHCRKRKRQTGANTREETKEELDNQK